MAQPEHRPAGLGGRRLLEQPEAESQPTFLDSHPLIRDLAEYGALLRAAYPPEEGFERKEAR